MVTLCHGTDSESADMIIEKGFKNPDSIWFCSDINKTYVVKGDDCYDDEDDFAYSEAFYFALTAAQIAAAHKDSRKTDVSIFRMQMTDEIFEDNFSPDLSCENMSDCYCIDSENLTQLIKNGQITLTRLTAFGAYNPNLRAIFLSSLSSYYIAKEPLLKVAIDKIKACIPSDTFYDLLDEYSGITEIVQELSKAEEKMYNNPFTTTIDIVKDIFVTPCNTSMLTNSSIINGYQINGCKIDNISYHLAYSAAILMTQKILLYGYKPIAPVVFKDMINFVFDCSEDKKNNLSKILTMKKRPECTNYWEEMEEDTNNSSPICTPNLFALNLALFWIVFDLWIARKVEDEKIIKLFKSILDDISPKNNEKSTFLPDINSFVSERLTLSPFQIAELKLARDFAEYFVNEDRKNGVKYAEYFKNLNYKSIIRTFRCLAELSSEDYIAIICDSDKRFGYKDEYFKQNKKYFSIDLNPEDDNYKVQKTYVMYYSCTIATYLVSYWSEFSFRWQVKQELEKYEKYILETEERCRKKISGYEKEKQSKKVYIRSLKDEIVRLKGEVEKSSADNVNRLNEKIGVLEATIEKERETQNALKTEYEQRLRKAEKASFRISNLERQVKALEEENDELEEQLKGFNIKEDAEVDECDECIGDDLYTSENLEIAKKCKFAFFVPNSADVTELSKLFPNSKILRSKRTTLDIGSSTEYVIACTKGLKHSTYWKIEDQCTHHNIGYMCINSYSPKTIFKTAIDVYKKTRTN